MTERIDQKDLLIVQMLNEGNYSINELKSQIRVRSVATVHQRLEKLESYGLIVQPKKRQPRSRYVTDKGKQLLRETGYLPSRRNDSILFRPRD